MRLYPLAVLLLLGACASHGELGLHDGQPGVDVADAALRGGSPQVALQIDDGILAKDPHNVAALINRGNVQTTMQLYDDAAVSYTTALQFDSDSVQARIGLGRLRLAKDPAGAELLFMTVLRTDSHNAVALNDLGIARDLQGRHQDAQQAYRQAMGLDPAMVGARVNLALSMAMAGHADDAAPMLRQVADAPSAPRKFRHDMAAVLAMGGDREGAERILSKDMSPEQATKAVAIFTAASEPAAVPLPAEATPPSRPSSAANSNGGVMVLLGRGPSSAALASNWTRLRRRLPQLLADRQPTLSQVEDNGHNIWRLLTGKFADEGAAATFCQAMTSKGASCVVGGT